MKEIKDMCVIIRGGGDLATGVAHRLFRSGFKVLLLEVASRWSCGGPCLLPRRLSTGKLLVEEMYRARNAHSIS